MRVWGLFQRDAVREERGGWWQAAAAGGGGGGGGSALALTSVSSNCSRISFHMGVPGALCSSLKPATARLASTSLDLRPLATSATPWCFSTSAVVRAHAGHEGILCGRWRLKELKVLE